jgi:hypothetical protein
MKLVIPFTGELEATDARLVRLAEFLGIVCEPIALESRDDHHASCLKQVQDSDACCLVVNPRVVKEWTRGSLSQELVWLLKSGFPFVLVHGATSDPFCQALIGALSDDVLPNIQAVTNSSGVYEMASTERQVCGPFSGLSFGPVNPLNDHVFAMAGNDSALRTPISINDKPFMVIMKRDKSTLLFLASADTLDVDGEVVDIPLTEYFSRFVPHAMALRYVFGEHCWRPNEACASFTIDDPLLRPRYGYLDFEALLKLMKDHNFATSIAFIPHNFRRNSKRTVRLFKENSNRLSVCYHGNDHTAAEFAATDASLLNTMIEIAEDRMAIHAKSNGLPCDRVMVFPQDSYSVEAMKVLKSRNFIAAVSGSSHPYQSRTHFAFKELIVPAILRYGGFPLFLRKYIGRTKPEEIACDIFFGKPALIYEHHGVFKNAENLAETVRSINSIAPKVRWCNLATAVATSYLRRKTKDGLCHIRAFSDTVMISNHSNEPQRFVVEWNHFTECPSIEHVCGGESNLSFEIGDSMIRTSVELPPRDTMLLSLCFRNDHPSLVGLGFQRSAKAFVRRRLSEMRDNYISKNELAMTVAQSMKQRLLSRIT